MDKLVAKSACSGLLPITIGGAKLVETEPEVITSIAPLKGQAAALQAALQAAHGLDLPEANQSCEAGDYRAVWGGSHIYVLGGPLVADIANVASVTDQTDAWSTVTLSGGGAEGVLARLVPIDTRLSAFPVGRAVRTKLAHLNVILTRASEDAFMIMTFRSMAVTLVHDLQQAMKTLNAREGIH